VSVVEAVGVDAAKADITVMRRLIFTIVKHFKRSPYFQKQASRGFLNSFNNDSFS